MKARLVGIVLLVVLVCSLALSANLAFAQEYGYPPPPASVGGETTYSSGGAGGWSLDGKILTITLAVTLAGAYLAMRRFRTTHTDQ